MNDAKTYVLYIIQKFVGLMFDGDIQIFSVSPGLLIVAASVLSILVAATLRYSHHPIRVGSASPRRIVSSPRSVVVHNHNITYQRGE